MSAAEIAPAVRSGRVKATDVVADALDRIAAWPELNAFTDVVTDRAMARARAGVDGPLAGVPFAVKNLFDVAGLPTRAGSLINRSLPPAAQDATLVARMEAAGAVLVGALNMGEYAYDFTGENVHDGPSRNPHDLTRMTGGSSGGSGGAVAGGLVPVSLGSDTNGSIRVPSSLCGLFGLKPTYGRLSRHGSFPFVSSFDHLGPLARSVTDLALSYDAMQGPDAADPCCAGRAAEPVAEGLEQGARGLRVAVAGGYFQHGASAEALAALRAVAAGLGADREVELPGAARARAAAYLISATEGAALHLERLRSRAGDYDPAVRDRLIAGALVPAPLVAQAQKFRRMFRAAVLALFETVDIILAPATPCSAPLLGQVMFDLGGRSVPVRANMGLYTQPISFIGLPVVAVPAAQSGLPVGVQVIAAPWREDLALRAAWALERDGVCVAPRPRGRLSMDINLPAVVAEVEAAFARYEAALVGNDVAVLDSLFWESPQVIRFGMSENLYGADEIAAFRAARPSVGLARRMSRTVITTFGEDFATAATLFHRDSAAGKVGRQMQTWARLPEGWRVVAAHVSLIDAP